jgi:UDP-N-acetylmuramoyl-tripeptide--D-alanyl-D-alanine ligase
MTPVSLKQLISATNGHWHPPGDIPQMDFHRVQLDSRQCGPGDLFWAVRGERLDGHQFISDALNRGARAAVVSQPLLKKLPQVVVEDTVSALGQFAGCYRKQQSSMVIGVTGSVGKTTTRHMIHAVLSARHQGVQSPRNFNNQYGVPLSLLQIDPQDEFAVIEVGASSPGEVAQLGRIVQHEVAVITSVSEAHLDGFGSIESVLASKTELIDTLDEGGFAVLNGDDARLLEYSRQLDIPVYLCGFGPQNHFQVELKQMTSDGMQFEINGEPFHLPVLGRHFLNAAAIAVAIATELGLEVDEIQAGLSRFQPVGGRCAPTRIGPWTVIDDTYNASPRSMQAACRLLSEWPGAEAARILVVGDMLELGEAAAAHHRTLGGLIARSNIGRLVTHGEFAQLVASAAIAGGMSPHQVAVCKSLETLELMLDCWLQPHDVILVKGSRGMKMERIVDWLEDAALRSAASGKKSKRLPSAA